MSRKKNIVQFIGEKLNDSQLIKEGENIKLDDIISNSAPKRTSEPLTHLTTKNMLEGVLNISRKNKKK